VENDPFIAEHDPKNDPRLNGITAILTGITAILNGITAILTGITARL